MARRDLLKDAFARWNRRLDSFEDALFARETAGLGELEAELAQARSMLDIIETRLSAIPASERADFEPQLAPLRARWGEAQEEYLAAQAEGGECRREGEKRSRAALEQVQDGLLGLVAQMNERFAGHPPSQAAPA
jgi:hypothetical protein